MTRNKERLNNKTYRRTFCDLWILISLIFWSIIDASLSVQTMAWSHQLRYNLINYIHYQQSSILLTRTMNICKAAEYCQPWLQRRIFPTFIHLHKRPYLEDSHPTIFLHLNHLSNMRTKVYHGAVVVPEKLLTFKSTFEGTCLWIRVKV